MERTGGKGIGDTNVSFANYFFLINYIIIYQYIQKKVPASKKYGAVQSKLTGSTGKSAKDVNIVSD